MAAWSQIPIRIVAVGSLIALIACGSEPALHTPKAPLELKHHGGAFLAAMHESYAAGGSNCTQMLRLLDASHPPFLIVLWRSFGAETSCLISYLQKYRGQKYDLVLHLSNEVCRRKDNCYSQELLPDLSPVELNAALERDDPAVGGAFKDRAREILTFCSTFESEYSRCLLGLGLESQYTEAAVRRIVALVTETGWHESALVHNPLGNNSYQGDGGAYYVERHGMFATVDDYPPERNVVSLDGHQPHFCDPFGRHDSNFFDRDRVFEWFRQIQSRANRVAVWCGMWQGLKQDSGMAPNPLGRYPDVSSEVVDSYITLMNGDS